MSPSRIDPKKDPEERPIRAEEVEKLRREAQHKSPNSPFREPRSISDITITAQFLFFVKQILDFIMNAIRTHTGESYASENMHRHLLCFKQALKSLMNEDKSQDAEFLKNLSMTWQCILEESITLKTKTSWRKKFKDLIREFDSYPEKSHSFEYYLDQYAGGKWLPFPYIELLSKLHKHHLLEQSTSRLSKWVQMLEELITIDMD